MIRGARTIPRIRAPSPRTFHQEYARLRQPVVLTGTLAGRAALERWSLAYLANKMGHVLVRVRSSERGARQVFAGDTQQAFDFETMTLSAALDGIDTRSGPVRYVQHADLGRSPELCSELGAFAYAPGVLCSQPLLWVCGPGTVNPLHWDHNQVALAQIVGSKRFVLFPPGDSTKLASFVDRTVWRTTALDLSRDEAADLPALAKATPWWCNVEPGEVLFIPYRWWHYMECDDLSISVSWWWSPSLPILARDFVREGAMSLAKRALRAVRPRASGRLRGPRRVSPRSPDAS